MALIWKEKMSFGMVMKGGKQKLSFAMDCLCPWDTHRRPQRPQCGAGICTLWIVPCRLGAKFQPQMHQKHLKGIQRAECGAGARVLPPLHFAGLG